MESLTCICPLSFSKDAKSSSSRKVSVSPSGSILLVLEYIFLLLSKIFNFLTLDCFSNTVE